MFGLAVTRGTKFCLIRGLVLNEGKPVGGVVMPVAAMDGWVGLVRGAVSTTDSATWAAAIELGAGVENWGGVMGGVAAMPGRLVLTD